MRGTRPIRLCPADSHLPIRSGFRSLLWFVIEFEAKAAAHAPRILAQADVRSEPLWTPPLILMTDAVATSQEHEGPW
jgi:hypothetical protein